MSVTVPGLSRPHLGRYKWWRTGQGSPVSLQPSLLTAHHIMLPVFIALIASAAANPDPIKLFETISAPELDIQSSAGIRTDAATGIRSVLMDQGVALAETTFDSSLEKSRCMARELCKFGANRDTEFAPAVSAFTVLSQT